VVGALFATVGVRAQRSLPLRAPLGTTVPTEIAGYHSRELTISPEELKVVGVTNYVARIYEGTDTAAGAPRGFTAYVGYYDRQTQGKTVHSPKNCLPGAGWEPLQSSVAQVSTVGGPVTVNRYLIQKGAQHALVLYWYQGRGRVASNEYRVKWDLLRDAALRHRSEEALVRVVVQFGASEAAALRLAEAAARALVPAIYAALPS
jgi:EpsI family protein